MKPAAFTHAKHANSYYYLVIYINFILTYLFIFKEVHLI